LTKFVESHNFTFDNVFDESATNEQVNCNLLTNLDLLNLRLAFG